VELTELITVTLNTLLEEVVALQKLGIILSTLSFVTILYLVGKALRIQIGIFSVVRKKHIIIMKWKRRKIMISQYSIHYKLIYNEH
jgi:hypothetical protein